MLCDVTEEAHRGWCALTIVLRRVLLFRSSCFIKYSLSPKNITLSYISLRAQERIEIKQHKTNKSNAWGVTFFCAQTS